MFSKLKYLVTCQGTSCRYIHACFSFKASHREGILMMKLLHGTRNPKKRHRLKESVENSNLIECAKISNLGTLGGGKLSNRRLSILNKLFMQHIIDQMACDDAVKGKSMQITKVKVSPSFSHVTIHWLSDSLQFQEEQQLSEILNNYSHTLRSNLSKLRIIGQVPPIRFVPDKAGILAIQVNKLLNDADYGEDPAIENYKLDDIDSQHFPVSSSQAKLEMPDLPPMRQDVLGLDHAEIMARLKRMSSKLTNKQHEEVINEFIGNDNETSDVSSVLQQFKKNQEQKFFKLSRKVQRVHQKPWQCQLDNDDKQSGDDYDTDDDFLPDDETTPKATS